jgi:hypothetical protein
MNLIGASIIASCVWFGLSTVSVFSTSLALSPTSETPQKLSSRVQFLATGTEDNELLQFFRKPYPNLEDTLNKPCHNVPAGVGIPGFKPGTLRTQVRQMFGTPTRTLTGYWPNTTAVIYDLIPNEVSLGFLFDKDSEILRQTEASFADSVESRVIQTTLNGMLGCQLSDSIKQGLQQIEQRQSNRYFFTTESLKGVIERDQRQRIYIGIWEADLH